MGASCIVEFAKGGRPRRARNANLWRGSAGEAMEPPAMSMMMVVKAQGEQFLKLKPAASVTIQP